MQNVFINQFPIALNQLLKSEAMVQSGGEAKVVIGQGLVQVNGEVETRIRKKIYAEDVIEFADYKIRVVEH